MTEFHKSGYRALASYFHILCIENKNKIGPTYRPYHWIGSHRPILGLCWAYIEDQIISNLPYHWICTKANLFACLYGVHFYFNNRVESLDPIWHVIIEWLDYLLEIWKDEYKNAYACPILIAKSSASPWCIVEESLVWGILAFLFIGFPVTKIK